VFEKIGKTKPAGRNELEITDCEHMYLGRTLTHSDLDGWWTDAGTFESLLRATNMVAQSGANKSQVVGLRRDMDETRIERASMMDMTNRVEEIGETA